MQSPNDVIEVDDSRIKRGRDVLERRFSPAKIVRPDAHR